MRGIRAPRMAVFIIGRLDSEMAAGESKFGLSLRLRCTASRCLRYGLCRGERRKSCAAIGGDYPFNFLASATVSGLASA